MILGREFTAEINKNDVLERATQFLIRSGYRQSETNSCVYRRGYSKLITMFSFSPKGWGVEATVFTATTDNTESTIVKISLSIDTTGQWITDKERTFWSKELESFENAVCNGKVDTSETADLARTSTTQNLLSYFIVIFSATIFFLCFTIIGITIAQSFTAMLIISFLGLSIGLFLGLGFTKGWMNYKINGKW
jgi:hypothetical protein